MNYLDSILIDEKSREPINPLPVTQLSETNIWIKKESRLEYFEDKTLFLIFDKPSINSNILCLHNMLFILQHI